MGNKNTKCPIDTDCHRHCRRDPWITKSCTEVLKVLRFWVCFEFGKKLEFELGWISLELPSWKTSGRKARFNSGIAQITPPPPSIRATLPTFSAVESTRDHLRDFYFVKQRCKKIWARVTPHFRAMLELKRVFLSKVFPRCPTWTHSILLKLPRGLHA